VESNAKTSKSGAKMEKVGVFGTKPYGIGRNIHREGIGLTKGRMEEIPKGRGKIKLLSKLEIDCS